MAVLSKKYTVKSPLTHPNIWLNLAGWAALASFFLPLALYCVVGLYTRYVADDYETAGSLNKYGFWGSQRFWYLGWSGRYAYFIIVNLFQMLGVRAAPFLAAVCLVLWLVALSWLIRQLLVGDTVHHPAYLAVLWSALVLVVTLRSMAHIHQILFWVTGILTYAAYLILLTFFMGWIVNRLRRGWQFHRLEIIAAAAYVFFLTGMSELSAALQLLFAVLAVLFFSFWHIHRPGRWTGLIFSVVLLLSALLGFVILLTAPGNAVRSAMLPPHPGIVPLALHANLNTVYFIGTWLKDHTLLVGIAFFLPALTGFMSYRPPQEAGELINRERAVLRGLLVSFPLLYLVLLAAFVTGYYALSANLPDRALVIPGYFLTLALMLWGYWSGSLLKGVLDPARALPKALKVLVGIVFGLMLLYGPLYASAYVYTMIEPARARAVEWDERDRIIRQAAQAGEHTVVVWYIRDLNRLGDYSSDPEFLVNRAAADYYGLDKIIALDERP
jgi:hypothetical protein